MSLWRRDAAGNADPATASDPVTLRYDPEPPQIAFDVSSGSDPTLVTAPVSDKVSGLADGTIELSAAGSNTWQTLDTRQDSGRLVARIDDATLPAGELRASRNGARSGRQPSPRRRNAPTVSRWPSPCRCAFSRRCRPASSRRAWSSRPCVGTASGEPSAVASPSSSPQGIVRFGQQAQISGRLTNRDGQGIADADVQVFATTEGGPEQLVGDVHTDACGGVQLHRRRQHEPDSALRLRRIAARPSGTKRSEHRRPRSEHAAGESPARAQRPAGHVQRPGPQRTDPRGREAHPARGAACPVAGRRSGPCARTKPAAGRCRIASRAPAASSGIASASSSRRRRATHSPPGPRSPSVSASGAAHDRRHHRTSEGDPRAPPLPPAPDLRQRDVHPGRVHRAGRQLVRRVHASTARRSRTDRSRARSSATTRSPEPRSRNRGWDAYHARSEPTRSAA